MLDTENYIPPLIGKHSSEDLDELASVSEILIWECDANWVFVHLYGDAKPVTGVSSNELVGKCMLDFLNPSDRHLLAVDQLRPAKEGTNWRRFTLKWQKPDQSQLSIRHALKTRFDAEGQITGFLGSSTDVTPIRH
jgi:PAS domain-containing protein